MAQSLPFGGVGISGFGRFGGAEGLQACCHMKSIITDMCVLVAVWLCGCGCGSGSGCVSVCLCVCVAVCALVVVAMCVGHVLTSLPCLFVHQCAGYPHPDPRRHPVSTERRLRQVHQGLAEHDVRRQPAGQLARHHGPHHCASNGCPGLGPGQEAGVVCRRSAVLCCSVVRGV